MLLLAIKLVYLVATALVGLSNVDGIPLASFYPFGLDANDCALPPNDDGSSPAVNLSTPFLYFGSSYSSLFVSLSCLVAHCAHRPVYSSTLTSSVLS